MCYTNPGSRQEKFERGAALLTPELFWELFKTTGSISHYLMYKKLNYD